MTFAALYDLAVRPLPTWPSSGNPTPTPGTPVLISNDTGGDYNAFPSLVVSGSTLHLAYYKGGDHNSTANAANVYQTKTAGGSWSALETAVAVGEHGAGVVISDPNLHVLPNGDVLMVYSTLTLATSVWTSYSKVRSGGVWGSAIPFTTDFADPGFMAPGGRSASWGYTTLHPVYARTTGSGLRGIYLYQSDIATPTTWAQRCNVAPIGFLSLDHEEPCLVRRSDGLGLCFIRDDTTKSIYLSWSPDLTHWSRPLYVFDGWGKPNAGINPDDDLLCITRHPTDSRAVYSFSNRRGEAGSWTASAYLGSALGAMMYGSVVWLDGWHAVYALAGEHGQPEEYNGPSELYEVTFS